MIHKKNASAQEDASEDLIDFVISKARAEGRTLDDVARGMADAKGADVSELSDS